MWCNTPIKVFFFHCSEQFLNSLILMTFSISAIFWFHLFYNSKTFPFDDFYHARKQTNKKYHWGKIRWIGRVGHGADAVLVKNCWTFSTLWAGALVNHPSWNRQTHWKCLQKNSLKQDAASHNNASWYTDTDGFLEQSPMREACTTRSLPSRR